MGKMKCAMLSEMNEKVKNKTKKQKRTVRILGVKVANALIKTGLMEVK